MEVWYSPSGKKGCRDDRTETAFRSPAFRSVVHVHVNAAVSVDGKLSTHQREQIRISGPADFDRVDTLRADADAIMVGIGTVLADDPRLTVDSEDRRAARTDRGEQPNPTRVVVDTRARTPLEARVLDASAPTLILVGTAAPEASVDSLEAQGAEIHTEGTDRVDLRAALSTLERAGIDELLVEGGGELVFSLFHEGLVDKLSVYVGSLLIGGRESPTLADGEGFIDREKFPDLALDAVERLGEGVLLRYAIDAGQ